MNDPFATPWDDAPETNEFAADTVITESTPVPGEIVSKPMSNAEVSITFKGDGGYDQPWKVVKANSVAELQKTLEDLKASNIDDLVKEINDAYASKVGRGNEKWEPRSNTPASRGHSAPASAPVSQPVAAAPASRIAPPSAGGPQSCKHGDRVYKEGVSKKTQQHYRMWACPAPWGTPDQCKPMFT